MKRLRNLKALRSTVEHRFPYFETPIYYFLSTMGPLFACFFYLLALEYIFPFLEHLPESPYKYAFLYGLLMFPVSAAFAFSISLSSSELLYQQTGLYKRLYWLLTAIFLVDLGVIISRLNALSIHYLSPLLDHSSLLVALEACSFLVAFVVSIVVLFPERVHLKNRVS